MSVKVVKEADQVGVFIGGSQFHDLKEVLRENHFQYKPNWNGLSHAWVSSGLPAIRGLSDLQKVEEFSLSEDFLSSLEPRKETQLFRIPYTPELLKSDPMGAYQEKGIKRGIRQNRLMLAWEMGLGKSFSVISILNHLHDKAELIDKVLVLAPSESVYNFMREFMQFSTFANNEEDFYIANVKNRDPFNSDAKVVIMTYRTFLMLSDDAYKKKTGKRSKKYTSECLPISNWGSSRALVADESHRVKNMKARQTKVLHIHKNFFDFRYLLTGTPDPNGVEGYYSQVSLMDHGYIGEPYASWLDSVANIGTPFSAYAVSSYKPQEVKKFMKKIDPLISREFTEGNLDLPELRVKKVYVGLSDKQQSIYQDLVDYVLGIVKKENGRVIPRIVQQKFPFIMQALENPGLLRGKILESVSPRLYNKIEKWKFTDNSKLEACSSLIDKYVGEGRKIILWSGHPLTMDQLAEHYSKYHPIVIHGQIDIPKGKSKEEHKHYLLEKFKKDPLHKVLIASYQVLSSAVNIVEATRSIYWDRSVNPELWMQSIKRNHRIGATEYVVASPIIIHHSLEERRDRELDRKDAMNKNLTNADSLSAEDWKALFTGGAIYE